MIKNLLLGLLLGLVLLSSGAFASFTVDVVSTNPAPVVAGDYADITLRFTNLGSTTGTLTQIKNVEFSIKESNFFLPLESEPAKFSVVNSQETITKTFRVFFSEDLGEGFINLPILISENGLKSEKDVTIYVEAVSRKPELLIGTIESSPSQLLRNSDDNVLKVNLLNLGDRDAELLSAKLIVSSDLITESHAFSMQDSLSSIEAGAEGVLEFDIDIDELVQSGVIDSSIELSYRSRTAVGNNYETIVESIDFNLPIDESPYLVIENVELLDSFTAGSVDNRVLISIKNEGDEEAEDVRVRISPDISFPLVFSQTTQYLSASLKPGESASLQFELEVVDGSVAREYISKVIITSMVGETRYSQDSTLSIITQESNKASEGSVGTILLVVVIIISLFIGFNVWRGKKKSSFEK
jgi:hypothetical protein